ncbi:hypothetical protein [uncultured Jatrophihabitans sp.]|uniref:hypothetical protein n=1 Tax=uncultured Jatrophihabitans sp. TaxID=1610747 RepID=UPI0035C98CFA
MVPAAQDPAPGWDREAAAGAGDHRGALGVHHREDDPDGKTEDLLLGSWELISGAGPGAAQVDLGQRTRDRARRPTSRGHRGVHGAARDAAGAAAARSGVQAHRRATQRLVRDLFMPGRAFTLPADFNDQFRDWLTRANSRVVRSIGACLLQRLHADLGCVKDLGQFLALLIKQRLLLFGGR